MNDLRNYKAIKMEDDVAKSYAVTEWGVNYPVMEINYNNKRFERKNLHRKAIEGEIDAGWLMNVPKNQALNYMPTHEMGHMLHNVLYEKHNPDLPKTKASRDDWIDGLVDKVYNEARNQSGLNNSDLDKHFISKYAKSNRRELFAELYARLKLGDKNALTEAFEKVMRDL
nr:hypothetical protein [Weissella kandleri]